MKRFYAIILTMLLFLACDNMFESENKAEIFLSGELVEYSQGDTLPAFYGFVVNKGTADGYNCTVTVTSFNSADSIISEAQGFAKEGENISPAERARFDVFLENLTSHATIDSYSVAVRFKSR